MDSLLNKLEALFEATEPLGKYDKDSGRHTNAVILNAHALKMMKINEKTKKNLSTKLPFSDNEHRSLLKLYKMLYGSYENALVAHKLTDDELEVIYNHSTNYPLYIKGVDTERLWQTNIPMLRMCNDWELLVHAHQIPGWSYPLEFDMDKIIRLLNAEYHISSKQWVNS